MIDPTILAMVPAALRGELEAGSIYRVGMLLFRRGEPGIVAHLVEAGGLPAATEAIIRTNPVLSLANVGLEAITVVQNEQIKKMLDMLKSLQLGSMALSGIGIGISVANYQLIDMRLKRVERQVESIEKRLEQLANRIDDLHADRIERDRIALKTACEQADGAWQVANPERDWREASDRLHELRNLFALRIRKLIEAGNLTEIEPFVDMFALAAATHVSCRVAAGDIELAIARSEESAKELAAMLQPIGSASLLQAQLRADGIQIGKARYAGALEKLRPFVEQQAKLYREREATAASAPVTLRRVHDLGMNGREWLEAARSVTTEPLLLLEGEAGAGAIARARAET